MDIRPIDANALWKRCSDLYDRHDNIVCAYEEISNAPTLRCEECKHFEGAYDCSALCEKKLSLNTLRDAIYQDAVEHGLWEDAEKDACELSEKEPHLCMKDGEVEYYRRYYASKLVFFEGDELLLAAEDDDFEGLKEELADVVIQAFSTAGYLGIDIDAAIRRKMEINKSRPWKHGKE